MRRFWLDIQCKAKPAFERPVVLIWLPALLLILWLEMAAYLNNQLLGLPFDFSPSSIALLGVSYHSAFWYVPILSLALVTCFFVGAYGLAKRIRHSEIALLIVAATLLTGVIINIPLAIFGAAHSLSPFNIFQGYLAIQSGTGFYISLILAVFAGFGFVFMPYIKKRKYAQDIYGHSHFATLFEIYMAGYLSRSIESILIAAYLNFRIYSKGFEHILVAAPSGSGKTTALAIPALLTFEGSAVALDLKGILYERTAGFRASVLKNECYNLVFASRDERSHGYNCFDFVSRDPVKRIAELQKIVAIMIPDVGKDDIWNKTARELLVAVAIYLFDTTGTCTLGDLAETIKQADFDKWFLALNQREGLDPQFYRMANSYLGIVAQETRSGIYFNVVGNLQLYLDPVVRAVTSHSDFDMRDLRRKKMTVYLSVPQNEMQRLAPILKLFWHLAMSAMNDHVPDIKEEPWPVLFLMDEFNSLGRMEDFRVNLSLLREYRVRCMLFFQHFGQMEEHYSAAEASTFKAMHTKIAFHQSDTKDARYVSELSKNKTVRFKNKGQSSNSRDTSQSLSEQTIKQPLLSEDDVKLLNDSKMLIFIDKQFPIKANKIYYYKKREFKAAQLPAPPVPTITPIVPKIQASVPAGKRKQKQARQVEMETTAAQEAVKDFFRAGERHGTQSN